MGSAIAYSTKYGFAAGGRPMQPKRPWVGRFIAACGLVGSISVPAQGPAGEAAWNECRKAPTNDCLIYEALRALQGADDSTARAMIGLAQAKAGQKQDALASFQRALTTIQSPGLNQVRGLLASGIAFAQAEAGFASDAAATFSLAKTYSMTSGRGAVELEAIGRQEARAGYIEAATKTATSINDARASSMVMRAIVDAHLKFGRMTEATAIAQSIVHEQIRADAIAAVVKSLASARKIAEAQRLLSAIERDEFGAGARAELARGQFKAGLTDEANRNFDRALSAARSIQDDVLRTQILGNIAQAQAGAGLTSAASATLTEALTMINPVSLPTRPAAIGILVNAEAEIGNFADAAKLARADDNAQRRSVLLYSIVKAEAKSGKIREAIDLAQSIEAAQARSLALTEVALVLP
jgi:tetratricopeptide (TPR) repeat protein